MVHSITPQKTVILIFAVMRISNVTEEQKFVVNLPEQAGGYWKNSDGHPRRGS
jgi:hypothetical protein